jgi:hypothetical protein
MNRKNTRQNSPKGIPPPPILPEDVIKVFLAGSPFNFGTKEYSFITTHLAFDNTFIQRVWYISYKPKPDHVKRRI